MVSLTLHEISALSQELRNRYEKNLLETLTDPVATMFVMITVKILSAHGTDEEYLDKDVHNYIKVRLHGSPQMFIASMLVDPLLYP